MVLNLPTDEATLPLVRNLCSRCLAEARVDPRCAADVDIAILDACTHVIDAAERADDTEYDVRVLINERACEVSVLDGALGIDFVTPLTFLDEQGSLDEPPPH